MGAGVAAGAALGAAAATVAAPRAAGAAAADASRAGGFGQLHQERVALIRLPATPRILSGALRHLGDPSFANSHDPRQPPLPGPRRRDGRRIQWERAGVRQGLGSQLPGATCQGHHRGHRSTQRDDAGASSDAASASTTRLVHSKRRAGSDPAHVCAASASASEAAAVGSTDDLSGSSPPHGRTTLRCPQAEPSRLPLLRYHLPACCSQRQPRNCKVGIMRLLAGSSRIHFIKTHAQERLDNGGPAGQTGGRLRGLACRPLRRGLVASLRRIGRRMRRRFAGRRRHLLIRGLRRADGLGLLLLSLPLLLGHRRWACLAVQAAVVLLAALLPGGCALCFDALQMNLAVQAASLLLAVISRFRSRDRHRAQGRRDSLDGSTAPVSLLGGGTLQSASQ
eukprot:scaffold1541_cov256-Pinguiococcus_pyrenoidosus.AAC.30